MYHHIIKLPHLKAPLSLTGLIRNTLYIAILEEKESRLLCETVNSGELVHKAHKLKKKGKKKENLRYEVLTVVTMLIMVSWVVVPCNLVGS
jgi:hypothetical protein